MMEPAVASPQHSVPSGEVWLPATPANRRLAASLLPVGEDVRLLHTPCGELVVVIRQDEVPHSWRADAHASKLSPAPAIGGRH